VIRAIEPADHAAAAAVYNHYVAHSTATFQTEPLTPEEWAAEMLAGDPARHGGWAIAAPEGGALAGYVLVVPYKSRCGYRDTAEVSVYLAPEHTGRGLGHAALAHADAHARAAGLHVLVAGACTENAASIALFERAGYERCALFREVGSKFGRRLDVAYLEKVVGSPP
jgi:phosphinothricin acetyltransferase